MKLLEERIRTHGKIREGGVLKVDSFLNHQMDVKLFQEMGKEFLRLFGNCGVTKILTIEASGIGIACVTAQFFDCPVIFAKKNKTRNIAGDVYTSKVESFTHGKVYDIIVSKEFLHPRTGYCSSTTFWPTARPCRASSTWCRMPAPPWWVRASVWRRPSSPAAT